MTRLEAIRQRLAAATPGPWHKRGEQSVVTSMSHPLCELSDPFHRQMEVRPGVVVTGKDADLIAHSPEDIALLLKVVDAALTVEEGCLPGPGDGGMVGPGPLRKLRDALAPLLADTEGA